MSDRIVETNIDHQIGKITLNRPKQRNALNVDMFDQLEQAIDKITAARDTVSVLHLTGQGPAFCSGFDLSEVRHKPEMMGVYIRRLSRVNRLLRRAPQVVVAEVHGAALAGGCALLGACDFVIVEASTKLGYPVHRIGVSPAVTLPTLLSAIGAGHARSLVLSGQIINGSEAVRLGLASQVETGKDHLKNATTALCQRITNNAPQTLAITKDWLNKSDGSLVDEIFNATANASCDLVGGDEAITMLADFWDRRTKSK